MPLSPYANLWLGCLAPRESAAFGIVQSYFDLGIDEIPRDLFDAAWALGGGTVGSARYNVFVSFAGFTLVTRPDPDGNPVDYWRFSIPAWGPVIASLGNPQSKYGPCAVRPPWTG